MDSGEPNLRERIYGHPAHEHELVFRHFRASGKILKRYCFADRCYKSIDDGDGMYACEGCPSRCCRFKMHSACAGIKAQMGAGELDKSESVAHKHDLVLRPFQGIGGSYGCSLCESSIKKEEEIYMCETSSRFDYCHFSAHKACCSVKAKIDAGRSNLPSRIYNHPAHSRHELVLGQFRPITVSTGRCYSYRCPNHHVINEAEEMYVCEDCSSAGFEFMIHSACARVKAQMEAGELDSSERIHDPAAHEHDLVPGHFQGIGISYNCSLCESNIKTGEEIYKCETSSRFDYCHFSAHKACCSIKAKIDDGESNLPYKIYRHPAHYEHELVLAQFRPYDDDVKERCDAYCCPNRHFITDGQEMYECGHRGCYGCEFKMHSACAGIKDQMDAGHPDLSKRIHHPAHDHAMVVRRHHQAIGDSCCSFCENNYKEGDEVYTCETSSHFDYCRFSIHKACRSTKAEVRMDVIVPDLPERIHGHPAHEDELVLSRFQPTGNVPLGICRAYRGCCNYLLEGDEIYACESGPSGCKCKFKMHSACAGVKAQINEGELDSSERIHHPDHKHCLVLRHFQLGNGDSCCTFCKNNFEEEDEIYSCETSTRFDCCHFSIHKACSSINSKMSNFPDRIYGHPAHEDELVLKTAAGPNIFDYCYAYHCSNKRIWEGGERYACESCSRDGCEFKMHRACAGVKAQMDAGEPDSSERIRHPAHDHALVLRQPQANRDSSCSSCGNSFKDEEEIYTCETSSRFDFCRFSIHKACSSIQAEVEAREANLPEMITHPDHEGGLVLSLYRGCLTERIFTCSVCKINRAKKGDEIYVCGNSSHTGCGFSMDAACGSIKAHVHFSGHDKDHLLVFLEQIDSDGQLECASCRGELSKKLFFSCMSCEHRIHLLCGPLPIAIPYHYSGYDMNLILTDTLLDGVDPEDSWCDICEERRDPGDCVYRSEYPLFTAATDCLLPQIVRALKGHFGEVRLRTVKGHLPGVVRPFTAQGSTKHNKLAELRTLLDDDAEEVIEDSDVENEKAGTISLKQLQDSLTEEDWEHIETCYLGFSEFFDGRHVIPYEFSDEAFELLKEHVATRGEYAQYVTEVWLGADCEFIKVGDNYVPSESIPLYRQLIEKHGDFTADSPLSQKGRSWALMLFLETMKRMQGLQTHQITADVLCTLQCSWKSLLCKAAGFSIQFALDNLEKVARASYGLKFIEVRDVITRDLTHQIQQLVSDIKDDEPRLEGLKVEYGRAKKESSFGKQCPLKVSKLQWKDAGEFLGLDPEE